MLVVNGVNSGTGAVNVTGAVLAGVGSISGTTTIGAGGTISPGTGGTSIGTLTVGALNFNGGTFAADFNGNTSDTIATSGTVNLNARTSGMFSLNSISGTTALGTVFTLINNSGAGAIQNAPLTGVAEGQQFNLAGVIGRASYKGGNGRSLTLSTNTPPTISATVAIRAKFCPSAGSWFWFTRHHIRQGPLS